MPPRTQVFPLSIDGGYNTEAGPSAGFRLRADGAISLPWLIAAENVVYNLDGWPQKMPGASKVNSSPTGATDSVMGVFDYWKSNTLGSPTQEKVIYAGTQIYKETGGGALTSLKTGLEPDKMPAFEVMNDFLIMATTSTVDVPLVYNQAVVADLGGTPPNFDFMVEYKGRLVAAGAASNKSRLYWTANGNPQDWTGPGSGSIDISPDDGDVITGLRVHKDQLFIFKGPYKGSIQYVSGSAPTGADAYALHPYVKGVGASNHQSILGVLDDVIFWDDFGIHSLVATPAYGNYNTTALSKDIATFFTDGLNHARFGFVSGAAFSTAGYALWTVSRNGSTMNDLVLLMDWRFTPIRFAVWPAYALAALGIVRDTNRKVTPWGGTYTGTLLRMNQAGRDVAGSAYSGRVLLPYVSAGDDFFDKHAFKGRLGYAPHSGAITVKYQRDGNAQQVATLTPMDSFDTLAPSTSQFTLDSSLLGGGRHVNAFFDLEGQWKQLQFELSQGDLDVDMEPHSLALQLEGAGGGTTKVPG